MGATMLDVSATGTEIAWPHVDKQKKPRSSCANLRLALQLMGVSCYYDEFAHRIMVEHHPLTDQIWQNLRVKVFERFGIEVNRVHMPDAIFQEATSVPFHPVKNFFATAEENWDKTRRLDTWLSVYLGAPLNDFTKAVSRISLLAGVARIYEPGTKHDAIIVLEGAEGKGKSSALRALAMQDEWFSDQTILGADDRTQQELLGGKLIYEIAELHGLATTQIEKIKAFCSRQFDRARPAYGRGVEERGRTCIIYATTNDATYLISGSGHRRIWPIQTGEIQLTLLRKDVDQLWGEAVARYRGGENFDLPAGLWDTARAEQMARVDHDIWQEKIEANLTAKLGDANVSLDEVAGWLEIPVERRDMKIQTRLGRCLRAAGWESFQPTKREGATRVSLSRRWRRKQAEIVCQTEPADVIRL